MVALWGSNVEAVSSEHLIDISSREPVVILVMGCTHKKQDCKSGCLSIRAYGFSDDVSYLFSVSPLQLCWIPCLHQRRYS
jgi:hypothetical protein